LIGLLGGENAGCRSAYKNANACIAPSLPGAPYSSSKSILFQTKVRQTVIAAVIGFQESGKSAFFDAV
jgi:hypothetical protein